MSKFSILLSSRCQSLDNIPGMTLSDPGNHCEYSRRLLSMGRSASCLWSIVFARVICGYLLGAGLRDFWSHHIAVMLYPIYRRNYSSSSVSSAILIHIDNSSAQNPNRWICAQTQYSLGICYLHALPFDLKPPIPIFQASVR